VALRRLSGSSASESQGLKTVKSGPATSVFVSILRQGDFLIASIHAALDDAELIQFQRDLVDQIGMHRARGIVIDVAALDVLDSFASKSLRDLAYMARLRGAETVIVGIQPEVAFALVQLARGLDVHSALDLEEGLTYLNAIVAKGGAVRGTPDEERR
jgi:rsbT antagonist protein RsbS